MIKDANIVRNAKYTTLQWTSQENIRFNEKHRGRIETFKMLAEGLIYLWRALNFD